MDTSCSTLAFTSSGYDDTVTLHAEQYEVLSYKLLFVQKSFACLFVHLFTHLFILVHTTIHIFPLSLTRSLTHSLTHLFIHSIIHSFMHSLVHSVGQDTLVITLTNDRRVGLRTHAMHEPQSNVVCRTCRPASLKGKHVSLASWHGRKNIASGKCIRVHPSIAGFT